MLAAVSEPFTRNEERAFERRTQTNRDPAKGKSRRRPGESRKQKTQKRSPKELQALREELCAAIRKKPGETMRYYASKLSSTPVKLGVPVRRLMEERRVHAVGDRSHRKYYPGVRE